MKVYRVYMRAYNLYYTCDRGGFDTIEMFFSTREKAEQWIKENSKYALGFENNEAPSEYEMPKFRIEEVGVF